MSSFTPVSAQDLLSYGQVIQQSNSAKYIVVSSIMFLVYDWFLTIRDEVELVWHARWGPSQLLYYLNRYSAFIDAGVLIYVTLIGDDASSCTSMLYLLGGLHSFGFVVAQLILAMRTRAVWGGKKWVSILLGSLIGATFAINACVLPIYLSGASYIAYPFHIRGCILEFKNRIVFADFLSVIVLESTMLALLVIRAWKHYDLTRSTLMKRMVRDGVTYFVYIAVASLFNLILIITAPVALHSILIAMQRFFHSIFCTRILLHIRAVSSEHHNAHLTSVTNSGLMRGENTQHSIRGSREDIVFVHSTETDEFELASDSAPHQFVCRVLYSTESVSSGWGQGNGFDDSGARPRRPSTNQKEQSARTSIGGTLC